MTPGGVTPISVGVAPISVGVAPILEGANPKIEKPLSIFLRGFGKSHTHRSIRLEKLVWKLSGKARDAFKSDEL